MVLTSCWRVFTRRRHKEDVEDHDSSSFRIFRSSSKRQQLSASVVGVGGALGVGVWVVCTEVARTAPGPAALVAFLLAMIASALTALCYVEYVSRLRSCGSAYTFAYYSVGELPAFVIGWTLVMDYTIGAAVAARSFSHHLDAFFDGLFSRIFGEFAPIEVVGFSNYFDFLAFATVLALGCFMLLTIRSTFVMSGVFTCIGLVSVLIVIIAGAIEADTSNWELSVRNVSVDCSLVFPYCCGGAVKGAAPALFVLAMAVCALGGAPDGKDPRASVRGGAVALIVVSCLCTAVITVISLAKPSHLLDPRLPLSELFNLTMWAVFGIVINIGGMLSLLASVFPAIYLSSHVLADMAGDKLVPCALAGSCSHESKVSAQAKLVSIMAAACFAGLFDMHSLLSMFSVGIIIAYLACSIGITILRYEKYENLSSNHANQRNESVGFCGGFLRLTKFRNSYGSTQFTSRFVNVTIILYCLSCIMVATCLLHYSIKETVVWILAIIGSVICFVCVLLIATQPTKGFNNSGFVVPLVPILPCFNILLLIFIAVTLETIAWIRFGVWLAFGLQIYFICIFCYNRGAKNVNVIDGKQKNGHIKGNLNQAFSISSENKNSVGSTSTKSRTRSEIRRASHAAAGAANHTPKPRASKALNDQDLIVSEGDLLHTLKLNGTSTAYYEYSPPVQKKVLEKAPDNDEISIIEMFDQMLATVEVPTDNTDSNCSDDVVSLARKVHPVIDDNDNDSDIITNIESSISSYKITEYNVVALVHREDKRYSVATDSADNKSLSSQLKFESALEPTEHNDIYTYSILKANESEKNITEPESIECLIVPGQDDEQSNSPIPAPPPMDEEYFAKSSHWSTPKAKKQPTPTDEQNEDKSVENRRESILSDEQMYDSIFGSKHQSSFMDRLNTLLQNQVVASPESQTPKPSRSISSDVVLDWNTTSKPNTLGRLHKELLSKRMEFSQEDEKADDSEDNAEPKIIERKRSAVALSREQIKSKLESLFSTNGNIMLGPKRNKKEFKNEDEDDSSDTKSAVHISSADVKTLQNTAKMDTLQLQRAKFGDVLNSLKLSRVVNDPVSNDDIVSGGTDMATSNSVNQTFHF